MKRFSLVTVVLSLGSACLAQDAARAPGWVVIPLAEYGVLRSRAYPVEREAPPEPAEATLSRVDYELRLDGAVASGRAGLTIDVLKDGWVRVPIPPGLLVREARLGGKPVSLVPMGHAGQLAAVLSGKGRSVLQLDVAFTADSSGDGQRLVLPTGAAGVTRASIAFAPQDVELKLTGGVASEKSATHWLAYARGGEPLTLAWHKKIEERRVELPLRLRGSLTQLFGLGEDSTSLNAEVEIEILQGAAREVKITVPENVTVNQVPGAMVADWDVKGGELVVRFLDPVEHSARFTISAETRLPREGAIDLPVLRLLDAERDSGGVAVEVLGAGEIKQSTPQGLEPADPAGLGPMVAARQSPSLAAFRPRPGAQARSLSVQVARYAQQAVLTANIEEARYRVLVSGDGKMLVEARYAVRNSQRNFVRITLPAGATVWSSSLAGQPVRPGKAPDGSLLFPLAKNRAGEEAAPFTVELLYLARGDAWSLRGKAALALPAVDLPVSRTGLQVYYPPLYRVAAEAGTFRVQTYDGPSTPVLNASAAAPPAAEPRAAGDATQALIDSYRARWGARRTAPALPTDMAFPEVGPSLYLVSELSGEGKAALLELNYQRERKGGVK